MSVVSGSRMRETIHSGHFMVSDFEPESEAQDEEYEVGMPVPAGTDEVLVKQPTNNAVATTSTFAQQQQTVQAQNNVPQDFLMDLPNFGRNFLAQNFGDFMPRQTQFQQPQALLPSFQQQQLQLQQKNSWISIDSSLTKLFQCMSLAYR